MILKMFVDVRGGSEIAELSLFHGENRGSIPLGRANFFGNPRGGVHSSVAASCPTCGRVYISSATSC